MYVYTTVADPGFPTVEWAQTYYLAKCLPKTA